MTADDSEAKGRLTGIELYNFKSYRGTTRVDFSDAYFTSIVGPNGSGKSNMMDAISFVLGVRSMHLRTMHLRDFVYRGRVLANDGAADFGTQSGDPTDAHVKAFYEQSDGTKLELTRRIVSSQGSAGREYKSQYLVNGKVVSFDEYLKRLAQENILVKAKNFLVFQGEVERVALMSPEDLTQLIEQISGSAEYKDEYDRLKRQQEVASENISSMFNKRKAFMSEITQFEVQTKQMKLHQDNVDRVGELTQQHMLWKLYHLEQGGERKNAEVAAARQQVEDALEHARATRAELEVVRARHADQLKKYNRQQRSHKEVGNQLSERKRALLPIEEKLRLMERRVDTQQRRLAELEAARERQQKAIDKVKADMRVVDRARAQFEDETERRAHREWDAKLTAPVLAEYERLKSEYTLRTAKEQTQLETLRRTRKTAHDKFLGVQSRQQSLQQQRERYEADVAELRSKHKQLELTKTESETMLRAKNKDLDAVRTTKRDLDNRMAERNQRLREISLKLLEFNATRHESDRDRAFRDNVLKLKEAFPGVKGFVYDLCVPKAKKYETAVAAVLGRHFSSIVVDTTRTAHEVINYLRENKAGVATCLPLDRLAARRVDNSLRTLGENYTLAIDCVEYVDEVAEAVRFVCQDTVVCRDMPAAKRLRWEFNKSVKAVTLDGSIIYRDNLMSGGSNEGSSANAQKWDQKEVDSLNRLKDRCMDDLRKAQEERLQVGNEEALAGEVSRLTHRLNQTRNELSRVAREIESRETELAHAVSELDQLEAPLNELQSEVEAVDAALADTESRVSGLKRDVFKPFVRKLGISDVAEFEEAQEAVAEGAAQERLKFSQQLARLEKQLLFEQDRLAETKRQFEMVESALERDRSAVESLTADRDKLASTIRSTEKSIAANAEKLDEARSQLQVSSTNADRYAAAVKEADAEVREARSSLDAIVGESSRFKHQWLNLLRSIKLEGQEIPLARGSLADVPLDEVAVPTLDEDSEMPDADAPQATTGMPDIEVDYSSLPADLRDSGDQSVGEQLQDEIARLQGEIDRASVNIHAAARLEQSRERLHDAEVEFTETSETRDQVSGEFKKVQEKRLSLFKKAYDHIADRIGPIYKELTRVASGAEGSAELNVGNTREPYLAGIVYTVTPPGKRYKDMSQLSGGEQSMAALALLFAIHSFQPSPFFVLDEVDAALDNANVAAVARYMQRHSRTGFQVIIISLKQGLFENSNALVGIYRDQEANSSQALTLDLRQYH